MYVRPDKAVRENLIVKMEEDRDAVQEAFGEAFRYEHIEHDVDFADHPAAVPPQIKQRVALCELRPSGGAVICVGAAVGATLDVHAGGMSILTAPAPCIPATPVPLIFLPGVVIPGGTVIDFIFSDGGDFSFGVSCNVQWVKNLDAPWNPPV